MHIYDGEEQKKENAREKMQNKIIMFINRQLNMFLLWVKHCSCVYEMKN